MKLKFLLSNILILSGIVATAQVNNFPANGNVGIGTDQPTSALHIRNDVSSSAENWVVRLQNNNTELGGLPTTGLLFAGGDFQSQKAGIIFRRTGSYGTGNLYFLNNNLLDGSLPTIANHSVMTLHSSGNVGIGTLSPVANLEIKSYGNIASLMIRHQNQQGDGLAGLVLAQRSDLSSTVDCHGCELKISSGWDKNLTIGSPEYNTHGGKILFPGGNIGIGTNSPKEKLSVNGNIRAREIKVETTNWPDYVFEEGYKVGTLEELEGYIKVNKRLPDMPSANEIETNGLVLGEVVKLQQKKIEELTLHLIKKDKQLQDDSYRIKNQQLQIDELKNECLEIKKYLAIKPKK